ncbi:hypothetical protein BST97_04570 [Nonlabens spongiae]|uniref:Uncharacterized protein n=1 Tax=Nonlabens spongiae TaxID=331648 RepID=A0A1W6MI94_9FLAO|nr:hypothetical protein BST97_04570 [Nonlabens spongiae]
MIQLDIGRNYVRQYFKFGIFNIITMKVISNQNFSMLDLRIAIALFATILFWALTYIPYLVQGSYVSIILQLLWIPALIYPLFSFIYFLVQWIKKSMNFSEPHLYFAVLSSSTYFLAFGEKLF